MLMHFPCLKQGTAFDYLLMLLAESGKSHRVRAMKPILVLFCSIWLLAFNWIGLSVAISNETGKYSRQCEILTLRICVY